MRRSVRKCILFLLSLVMLLSMVPLTAYAESSTLITAFRGPQDGPPDSFGEPISSAADVSALVSGGVYIRHVSGRYFKDTTAVQSGTTGIAKTGVISKPSDGAAIFFFEPDPAAAGRFKVYTKDAAGERRYIKQNGANLTFASEDEASGFTVAPFSTQTDAFTVQGSDGRYWNQWGGNGGSIFGAWTSGTDANSSLQFVPAMDGELRVSPEGIWILAAQTSQLTSATFPDGAAVTWTSADPDIATVDENTGLVTGVAVGTTTVTASAVIYGREFTDECAVSVINHPPQGDVLVQSSVSNPINVPTGTALTTYDLQSDTTGTIDLIYSPPQSGTLNTVIVATWPAYGTKILTLPTEGLNGISKIVRLNDHTIAIKLDDGIVEQCDYQISIETTGLTQEQAEQWLDDTALPETRFAAYEYYTQGAPKDVLSEGLLLASYEGAPMQPKVYGSTELSVTHASEFNTGSYDHTFHFSVSTDPGVCNHLLDGAGYYRWNDYVGMGPYVNGVLRWNIPTPHSNGNDLFEIKSIRVYMPSEELKLTAVGNILNTDYNGRSARDLVPADFDGYFDWTLGERQYDAALGASYYEITPSVRWFNRGLGEQGDITDKFYGMRLNFQLVSTDDPLEGSDTGYTDYIAKDTVITYRVAGESADSTFTQQGPHINVYKQGTALPTHAYNSVRIHNPNSPEVSDENVIIGSYHIDEAATYFNNQFYFTESTSGRVLGQTGITGGTPKTELFPAHEGPVTQTYEFPYNIQPTKIYLHEGSARAHTWSTHSEVLSAITYYTTSDGTTLTPHSIPQDEITAFNESILALGNSASYSASPISQCFEFSEHADGERVAKVVVDWDSLYVHATYGYAPRDPYYNRIWYNRRAPLAGSGCVMGSSFDYWVKGETSDTDSTLLPQYTEVQALYTVSYGGTGAPATYQDDQWLWYRLKQPLCPSLYGNDTPVMGGSSRRGSALDNNEEPIGNIGLYIAHYGERRDDMTNPVIDLRMYLHAAGPDDGVYRENRLDMPEEHAWAFFTGAFTAMPKLSGWVFSYTTHDHPEGLTWQVPEITSEGGQAVQIPLDPGDWFTGMSISYDGVVLVPHDGPEDTKDLVWLMQDIMIRRIDTDPFTGEAITASSGGDYYETRVSMDGFLHLDDCSCSDHAHTYNYEDSGNPGQLMTAPSGDYNKWAMLPGRFVFPTRQAVLQYDGLAQEPTDLSVAQGSTVNVSFTPLINFANAPSSDPISGQSWALFHYNSQYQIRPTKDRGTNNNGAFMPWDIRYAVYVELTDTENFTVDLSQTTYYRDRADDASRVETEVVTVTDSGGQEHTFLKLQLVEGALQNGSWNPAYQYNYDVRFKDYPGWAYYWHQNGVGDVISIAFTALPGAEEGAHYPIGKVYYDYSELLDKYDAPNAQTGYDNDWTNYLLQNAVEDVYDLHPHTSDYTAHTASETERLFLTDFSQGSSTAQKITVTKAVQVGANIYPGKQGLYDVTTLETHFTPDQNNDLNALVTITGSVTQNVYMVHDYITLPRVGKSITYRDEEGGDIATATGELDLFLRGPLSLLSDTIVDTDGEGNPLPPHQITITYTRDASPGADSTWLTAEQIGSDWAGVTGVQIYADRMSYNSAIRFRMNLRAPEKTEVGTLNAYSGGYYTYVPNNPDSNMNQDWMNLATWVYDDVLIRGGSVFWDTLDENGTRNGNDTTEPLINGLTVALYKPGTTAFTAEDLISSVTTADGTFTLPTYLTTEGQILRLQFPSDGGNTIYLTKKLNSAYATSLVDSDFVRKNGDEYVTDWAVVTLPRLSSVGLSGVSAGFVKLPKISVQDVDLQVGETGTMTAIIDEFVTNTTYNANNILINGGYKLSCAGVDSGIATLESLSALARNGNSTTQLKSIFTFKGVGAGQYPVTVTLKNALDDEVTATFTVTVTQRENITVTKVWDDADDVDGVRPDSITLQLKAGDKNIGTPVELPISGSNTPWTYTWTDMPRYDEQFAEIEYSVVESEIPQPEGHPTGYSTSYDKSEFSEEDHGYTITVTNTYVPSVVITYKLNGGHYPQFFGSQDDIVEIYPRGSTITIHEKPYRSGYTFLHWEGSKYYPGDSYVANEDHVFVAQWQHRNSWSPLTGDHTPWLPWIGVLVLSGAALGVDAVIRKRKRGKDKK